MKHKTQGLTAVIISLLILLSACGENAGSESDAAGTGIKAENTNIVTSFYPMYIFTSNIAKDIPGVKVTNMTEPQTGCLHDYQLNPADMKTLENADILVINGAGMESFMNKVINRLPDIKVVEASKGLELLWDEHEREEDGKTAEAAGSEHEEEGEVNPHIWVSISGAIDEVKNIGRQLEELDPKNAQKYRTNTDEYVKKLETQKQKMHKALDGIKNRDIVTFHEAFPYFAKEFNLNIIAVIEREPGTEPTAGELTDTIDKVRKSGIKALFAEPQYSQKAADTISRETGAKVYVLDPVSTGPKNAAPEAYIKIMDQNLNTLLEALT